MTSPSFVRWSLLILWLVSALAIIAIFGERMFGHRQLAMRADEIAASFKTVLAFYTPTIGLMLSYLFSIPSQSEQEALSAAQVRAVVGLSVCYHVCCIVVVVMGISLNMFDQSLPGGEGFAANTSTVASLLGGLSLLLVPVNVIFLKAKGKGGSND